MPRRGLRRANSFKFVGNQRYEIVTDMSDTNSLELVQNGKATFSAKDLETYKTNGIVEDIRVLEIPFVVSGPAAKGLRLNEPMMLEDVAPTIAALLGIEIPAAWRGRPAANR